MGRGNNFVIAFFDSDSFLSKNYVGQKILILHIYCCQTCFCFSRHRIILWQWFSQSHKHSVWWMVKILLSNLSDPGLEKEVNWVSIPINVNMLSLRGEIFENILSLFAMRSTWDNITLCLCDLEILIYDVWLSPFRSKLSF